MDVQQSNSVATTGRDRPHVTGTGREAESLHDAGLNPFLVIPASRDPYASHGFLATTRLYRQSLGELRDRQIRRGAGPC